VVPVTHSNLGKSAKTRQVLAELKVALTQRRLINSSPIRRLLNGRIRDLKAELLAFGGF
jgi:hypothetical protein